MNNGNELERADTAIKNYINGRFRLFIPEFDVDSENIEVVSLRSSSSSEFGVGSLLNAYPLRALLNQPPLPPPGEFKQFDKSFLQQNWILLEKFLSNVVVFVALLFPLPLQTGMFSDFFNTSVLGASAKDLTQCFIDFIVENSGRFFQVKDRAGNWNKHPNTDRVLYLLLNKHCNIVTSRIRTFNKKKSYENSANMTLKGLVASLNENTDDLFAKGTTLRQITDLENYPGFNPFFFVDDFTGIVSPKEFKITTINPIQKRPRLADCLSFAFKSVSDSKESIHSSVISDFNQPIGQMRSKLKRYMLDHMDPLLNTKSSQELQHELNEVTSNTLLQKFMHRNSNTPEDTMVRILHVYVERNGLRVMRW